MCGVYSGDWFVTCVECILLIGLLHVECILLIDLLHVECILLIGLLHVWSVFW